MMYDCIICSLNVAKSVALGSTISSYTDQSLYWEPVQLHIHAVVKSANHVPEHNAKK